MDAVLRLLHIERVCWCTAQYDIRTDVRSQLANVGAVNWSWRDCLAALVLHACNR